MPKVPFFTGDFYTLDDPGSEIAQVINLYPEVIESGKGKDVGRLVGTPGYQLFAEVGDGPIRATWMGEGRLFVVSGSHIYEVFADGVSTDLGDVGDVGSGAGVDSVHLHPPAQIFSNGNELLVISAGYAWRVYTDDGGTHVAHIQLIAAEYTDLAIGVTAFLYDLAIRDDDNTKVTSAARPFQAGDAGLDLYIDSGVDFTPGHYNIVSVVGEVATLDGPCGVAGATEGAGEIVDATANDTVSSPTLPFVAADVGSTLVIAAGAGFGDGGTYTIDSVTDGIATLSTGVGDSGTLGGVATQYPGESAATDADGNLKAGTGAYLDGYGIIAPPPQATALTDTFYISDHVSGVGFAHWSALDKARKEGAPDNILALLADHEELYIFGDLYSTEVWRDTGAANFPFEREMSAYMTWGLAAQWSVSPLGLNGIAWLAWSAGKGSPQAFYAAGFQPQRISTSMLEHIWDGYDTTRDARAFSYVEDGHQFWVINFPSADITWCYDLTASQQMGRPMWHVRASWDATTETWHRSRASCHTYGYFADNAAHPALFWTRGLTHFVGDYQAGKLYVQGLYNFDDGGAPIRRELTMPHMANENVRTVWHLFQLECLVGAAASATEDVVWTLDYSRDRGETFLNPRDRTALATGKRNQRLRWWRCGESYDQVWRLHTESKAKVSLTSAWFDASGATS